MVKSICTDGRTWTYGTEHELADWDTRKGWPKGYGRDPEINGVNSNGISFDPALKSYPFGAEINTPPTSEPEGQADALSRFLKMHPNASANYRTGMHVHIRVPGLKDNLVHLKKLARYILQNRIVYDLVDPLPRENPKQHITPQELKAARRRFNWMNMSHKTVIKEDRVRLQEQASNLTEFFEREVPRSKTGKPLWHAQPRAAVNLRQLLQTDTIEFRHFPQTLDPDEVLNSVNWCRDYLLAAFAGHPAERVFHSSYAKVRFPKLDTIYVGWMEERWLRTTPTKNKRSEVEKAIQEILKQERMKQTF